MRRIAIWIHGGIGGGLFSQGQPAIQQLVTKLASRFEVDVYSLLPPNLDFDPPGFTIFYLRSGIRWRFIRWLYLVLKFFTISFQNSYHLTYGFWGYPAGGFAVLVAKIFRIPSVIHLQGGDAVALPSLNYGVFSHPVRAKICRFIYSRSTVLITLSEFQAARLRENRVTKSPVIIPFGPDISQFKFKPERFDHAVVRFLHVGNQTPVKGQKTMLSVFCQVAQRLPSRLVIIGEDYYNGQLKEWCISLGVEEQVEFLGPQPYNRMAGFYYDADILLHTPYYEGQGLVFAEAAACGTIIAGTEVGMLADMGKECALIAAPGEDGTLANKIIAALTSKDLLKQMQVTARRWVEEKDVNYTESRIVGILNELMLPCRSNKN
ncbi:MAG TPA: glycosyltransferase family 4 protein [Chryseosolibacter sp.]|jgi:Glycosyltransferase